MSLPSIGKIGLLTKAFFRNHGLTPFREILPPDLFRAISWKTYRASTVLIPEAVFWLMAVVALGDGIMAAAVKTFWAPLRALMPGLPSEPVTEEAFCMARRKTPLSFFRRLFTWLVEFFEEKQGKRFTWKGFRLLGIDGSTISLAPGKLISAFFPRAKNQKGESKRAKARLVGLVGLWDAVCRAFVLVPLDYGEQWCARVLVRYLRAKDLLLADRNFATVSFFWDVVSRGADFLVRCPCTRFHKKKRKPTPSGRPEEYYIEIQRPSKKGKTSAGKTDTLIVRVLEYQLPGFRTSRLITTLLDTQLFPYEEVVSLYHERWRHETLYREWKYTLQINNLRSHSKEGILKEIYVQITLNNAMRWIMADAVEDGLRPVDLSFLQTRRHINQVIPVMAVAKTEYLPFLYRRLLKDIRREEILVRPGRSYPRLHDGKPRNKGNGVFAAPAREAAASDRGPDHVFD